MKRTTTPKVSLAIALFLLLLTGSGFATGVAPTRPQNELGGGSLRVSTNGRLLITLLRQATRSSDDELKAVLGQMDESSQHFRNAQADVELVQYTEVVKEKDTQSGQIFFRRKGHDTEISLWIEQPHPKRAVVKDDKLTFFDPRTRQITQRSLGNNKADVEAVMNLGFGSRGHELLEDYDATFAGWETIDGTRTARLELVAKSPKLRQFFSKVVLWIDPTRDVALQQQRFESSGDYQLTHYSNIKLNERIDEQKFVIEK